MARLIRECCLANFRSYSRVAQVVEQVTVNHRVGGSSPSSGAVIRLADASTCKKRALSKESARFAFCWTPAGQGLPFLRIYVTSLDRDQRSSGVNCDRLVAVTCITLREIHEIVLFFVCHRPRVAEYWNCRRPNPLGAREYSVTSRGSKYLGGSAQWAANPGASRIFGCPSCGRAFEISVPLGPAARSYRGNHWRDRRRSD